MSQYESPDLILDIVSGRVAAADDPNWSRSGAPTREAYGAWAGRICGLACLRAVLRHRGDPDPGPFELIRRCAPFGVYDETGGAASPGLRYRPFVAYLAAEHGIGATVVEAPVGDALTGATLAGGGFLIWSVHRGIRHPDVAPPATGGHLVLIHRFDPATGWVAFCNPSGHTDGARAARLPLEVFGRFAADRGMALTF